MDVAVVVELRGESDWNGSREAGDIILQNITVVNSLAGNVGVDNACHLEDVLDVDAGGFLGGFILADDDSGILGAGGGIFGDGDGEFNVLGLVWL